MRYCIKRVCGCVFFHCGKNNECLPCPISGAIVSDFIVFWTLLDKTNSYIICTACSFRSRLRRSREQQGLVLFLEGRYLTIKVAAPISLQVLYRVRWHGLSDRYYGRRLPQHMVRRFVIFASSAITAYFFYDAYFST